MFIEHLPVTVLSAGHTGRNRLLVAAFLALTLRMSWSWTGNRDTQGMNE